MTDLATKVTRAEKGLIKSMFYFMSVHIEVILHKTKQAKNNNKKQTKHNKQTKTNKKKKKKKKKKRIMYIILTYPQHYEQSI